MPYLVEANTLDDLMNKVFNTLFDEGHSVAATRGSNLEIVGVLLTLSNPRARLSQSERRRKAASAIAELCWYLSGSADASMISYWIPKYQDEAEDTGIIHGAYGPRLFGTGENAQVLRVIELLRKEPNTRRAVIQVFDRSDIASSVRFHDIPCTTTIQFLLRDNHLHMLVTMRSNDAYFGLPHDVFAFTMLQELVSREVGVELGTYQHMVGSLHIYVDAFEKAKHFLNEGWQSSLHAMPPMPIGSQQDHIKDLLDTEAQLRQGIDYSAISLPQDQYWADLARLLSISRSRKLHNPREAEMIVRGIKDATLKTIAWADLVRRGVPAEPAGIEHQT